MALNAQGWGAVGGVAPWRAILKDSEKKYTENSMLRSLPEHKPLSVKRRNSWKVGNLEMISHISPPTQANNK